MRVLVACEYSGRVPDQVTPDPFVPDLLCACAALPLADEADLIGDAADDELVHGALACVRALVTR